jgi:hypothetical protein
MTDVNHIPPLTPRDNNTQNNETSNLSPTEDNVAVTLARLHQNQPPPPPALYIPYSQLEQLLKSVLSQQSQPKTKDDNPLIQARLEHFVSQGTSLKFDGDQEKLVPWIKRFRSLRTNAVWQPATYVKDDTNTYDLLTEFTKITETIIKEQAMNRWTPTNQSKSLSQDNPEFYFPRILGKVIINSVTDDFYTILQNYAGLDLCNDGPYLLWLILSHFHTSTITYTERIRNSIRTRSLSNDHNNDVEAYLLWLRHQLDILTTNQTTEDNTNMDLIEPIFLQLLATTSKRLRRTIEDWHLAHHNNEKKFTALSLVASVEKTTKALRCTGQLYTEPDPEIAVLHAKMTKQADLTQQAFQVITNTLHNHNQGQTNGLQTSQGTKKPPNKQSGHITRTPKPDWYHKPPKNPSETHKHDGRDWYWCPKCGRDQQGKWVCTHLPADHKDGFTKKRLNDADQNTPKKPKTSTTPTSSATQLTQAHIAQLAQAHAQLTALLAAAPIPILGPITQPTQSGTPLGQTEDTQQDLLSFDDW